MSHLINPWESMVMPPLVMTNPSKIETRQQIAKPLPYHKINSMQPCHEHPGNLFTWSDVIVSSQCHTLSFWLTPRISLGQQEHLCLASWGANMQPQLQCGGLCQPSLPTSAQPISYQSSTCSWSIWSQVTHNKWITPPWVEISLEATAFNLKVLINAYLNLNQVTCTPHPSPLSYGSEFWSMEAMDNVPITPIMGSDWPLKPLNKKDL